ncbi:MAG: LysR family transcriptional regulator [Oceanicaulis sp.]
MDVRQVTHFLALVETGNFARAADKVGITQSALTQSIGRLEQQLGARLFERGRFGASLNDAGELLLPRAKLIDAERRLAMAEFDALKHASRGEVSIGIGKSVTQWCVPTALQRFHRRRPHVAVTAVEGWSADLYRKLLHGELDFVVSAPLPDLAVDDELAQEHLFFQHEALVISQRSPIASKPEIELADLADLRWIVPPVGSGRVRHVQHVFMQAGLEPPTKFLRTDSVQLLMAYVEAGPAVAMVTLELISPANNAGAFRVLDFKEFAEERAATLTRRRRSRLRPHAEALAVEFRKLTGETGA